MIEIRKGVERGYADHGWLQSWHSFSFADYYDPAHMGFGPLRVINEDYIAPGQGFGMHGHRDMEIVTYLLQGTLAHRDSLGNGSSIESGEVQRMSAGTGVRHSEYNHSTTAPVHLLQIWVEPAVMGIQPGYEQKHFDIASRRGLMQLIASPDARDGSVLIHQDAYIYALSPGATCAVEQVLAPGRRAYVHLIAGQADVNGVALTAGDAAKIVGESTVQLTRVADVELLLFDLP